VQIASVVDICTIGLQSMTPNAIYRKCRTGSNIGACGFASLGVDNALTSHGCADKNANFLRQAVNFASRNGRSADISWKDQVLSAV